MADIYASDLFLAKDDQVAANWFKAFIAGSSPARIGETCFTDTFVSDTLATKTNATYESGMYKSLMSTLLTGGTASGNMTAYGGLAAAFDGTTNQDQAHGCGKNPSASGYGNTVGKDWGGSKIVTRLQIYGVNDSHLITGVGGGNFKLQGSTDNFASSNVDLYSGSFPSGMAQSVDIQSGIDLSTAYRYHRINFSGNGSTSLQIAEARFYANEKTNVTLIPSPVTASAAPSRMTVYFLINPVDAVTPNTDVKARVSRDNGSHWSDYGILKLVRAYDGTYGLYRAGFIASQLPASGTSLLWELTSYNNKQIQVRGWHLSWR